MNLRHELIPVVIINLARSTERREVMRRNLDDLGIAHRFFAAVEGRAMSAAEIDRLSPRPVVAEYGRPLSPGEIGCIASYHRLLLEIANGPDEHVCILEDDARLEPVAKDFLDRGFLASLPAFDVLRIGGDLGRSRYVVPIAERAGRRVTLPARAYYCATGQIFSRDGARLAARRLVPAYAPLDHILFRDPFSRLRILDVRPFPVHPQGTPSTMEDVRFAKDYAGRRSPRHWLRRGLALMLRKAAVAPCLLSRWEMTTLARMRRTGD